METSVICGVGFIVGLASLIYLRIRIGAGIFERYNKALVRYWVLCVLGGEICILFLRGLYFWPSTHFAAVVCFTLAAFFVWVFKPVSRGAEQMDALPFIHLPLCIPAIFLGFLVLAESRGAWHSASPMIYMGDTGISRRGLYFVVASVAIRTPGALLSALRIFLEADWSRRFSSARSLVESAGITAGMVFLAWMGFIIGLIDLFASGYSVFS